MGKNNNQRYYGKRRQEKSNGSFQRNNEYSDNLFRTSSGITFPKDVVKSIMHHSVATNVRRFEINGEITYGRKNYELFINKAKSNQLAKLINNEFTIPDEPEKPGDLDSHLEDNVLSQPPKDIENEDVAKVQFMLLKVKPEDRPEYEFNDFYNPSDEDIEHASNAIENYRPWQKKFDDYYEKRVSQHSKLNETFLNEVRNEKQAYYAKMNEYQKSLEFRQKLMKEYEEKAIKFNTLMREYFSDNIIARVNDLITANDYVGALKKLKELVFNGTKEEGEILLKILNSTVFHSNMNYNLFKDAVEFIFEMLKECTMERSDQEKLRLLEKMIHNGDHSYFKKTLEIASISADYSFDTACARLDAVYERTKLDAYNEPKSSSKRSYSTMEGMHSANSVFTTSNTDNSVHAKKALIYCDICKRPHRGKHNDDLAKLAPKRFKVQTSENKSQQKQKDNNKKSSKGKANDQSKSATANQVLVIDSEDEQTILDFCQMVSEDSDSHIAQRICSDSGASTSMTPDTNRLSNVSSTQTQVQVANGHSTEVTGRGNIGNLTDVLLVPHLKDTLLSVSQLDKNGYFHLYGHGQVVIYNGNPTKPNAEIVAVGRLENNGLYYFDDENFPKLVLHMANKTQPQKICGPKSKKSRHEHARNTEDIEGIAAPGEYWDSPEFRNAPEPAEDVHSTVEEDGQEVEPEEENVEPEEVDIDETNSPPPPSLPTGTLSNPQEKLNDLHNRTGLSKSGLFRVIQQNAVNDSGINPKAGKLNMENSEAWFQGNMRKRYLPPSQDRKEFQIGEFICGDIGAKFPVLQRNRSYYPFFFIDVTSKFLFVYFGRTKSDISNCLRKLYQTVAYHGHTWKYLQTDSESIFEGGKVPDILNTFNIGIRYSSPYKHEQNGDIERHIGMIYDLSRTHMIASSASRFLFADAIKYAVFILNHFRVPYNRTMTPAEMFTKQKPSFKMAHPFYQKVAVWKSKEERKGKGKLIPRSDILIFIGYADDHKDSFLVYNPIDKSVKVRHDVHWISGTANQALIESTKRVPKTLKEALSGPDKDIWIEAIKKEMKECFSRGTFIVFKGETDSKPLKSRIVLDIKADGTYKARWVACGYSQIYGRDFDATFSPTASFK